MTSNAPDKIYQYINQGTTIRHARMSANYTPKTERGRIPSVAGSGKRVKVSWGINIKPGIKGRWFNQSIRKKHAETFPKLMSKYIKEEFKTSFPH